jgi:hypothetical protein
MNYSGDDYTMGHILKFACETYLDTMVIDLVTGAAQPAELLREPISNVPRWYTKMFWDLMVRSGSDPNFVRSATLKLSYDLRQKRKWAYADAPEAPYSCQVSIVDDRGKKYSACLTGWWHAEQPRLSPSWRHRWNPFNWFRRRS